MNKKQRTENLKRIHTYIFFNISLKVFVQRLYHVIFVFGRFFFVFGLEKYMDIQISEREKKTKRAREERLSKKI